MPESEKPKRRWARFSLATLLFISLCIGGLLGGYQAGYRRGYHSGAAQLRNETQSAETYSTSIVIWPDLPATELAAAIEQLKDLITSTVCTDVWGAGTGNEIRDFPDNQALVIVAPGYVHTEIRDLFAQLERVQTNGMAESLLPTLQGMASRGKAEQHIIPVSVPKTSRMAQAWLEKCYESTIDNTSKHWGAPSFSGKCTDANFPKWSLDQQIATWPRGNGVSFLALRVADDGKLQLVAGWHGKS